MLRRRPRIRSGLVGGLAVVALLGAACGDDDPDTSDLESGEVLVVDNVFRPDRVEVGVGDTVTWRFEGSLPHNVSPAGDNRREWEASDTMTDGTYEWTFERAGSYDYVCTIHPGMDGTVVVS